MADSRDGQKANGAAMGLHSRTRHASDRIGARRLLLRLCGLFEADLYRSIPAEILELSEHGGLEPLPYLGSMGRPTLEREAQTVAFDGGLSDHSGEPQALTADGIPHTSCCGLDYCVGFVFTHH